MGYSSNHNRSKRLGVSRGYPDTKRFTYPRMQPHPSQPHRSVYNNTIARARKGSDATVTMSAASQAPHIPRAMRIAERDAEYRQHQSPNGGRQTAQPASSGWHESKNMRDAHPAPTPKSQHHLGATDNTRAAAAAVRCCRACFPCASPASSSCWAGLKSCLYVNF